MLSSGEGRTVPSKPQTTSPQQAEMSGGELSGEMVESDTVTPDPAEDPFVLDQLDSEEGRAGQDKQMIVWDQGPESSGSGGGAPLASTSPVRGAGRGSTTSETPTGAGAAPVS